MLKITRSRDLFHINYLFVKFIVETLCTFYDFFSIHKQTFYVLGLIEIKLLSKERLFDILFDFLIQWYDFRTYIDHLKIFLILWGYKTKVKNIPSKKSSVNFLKQNLNIRHIFIASEISSRKRNPWEISLAGSPFNFYLKPLISVKFSSIIEENAFKYGTAEQTFVNYVELFEFNYFELIYYTVRQSLLQICKNVSKWDSFITKQCKHYFKLGQLCAITKQGKKLW